MYFFSLIEFYNLLFSSSNHADIHFVTMHYKHSGYISRKSKYSIFLTDFLFIYQDIENINTKFK